jgi:D-sedoheptulose 7-phosphate isomerase
MSDTVEKHINDSIAVKRKLLASKITIDSIHALVDMCVMVYKGGGKILIAGNGGSAADSRLIPNVVSVAAVLAPLDPSV